MAIVPFKLWEDMKRWKEEQIQKPRLPPDPNVSATASLQRDLSSVMANEDYGKSIPGSNIIDLVNDVIRHRKGSEPTGWQAFAEGLRDINIPQDVIGNRERWDWMHRVPETPEMDYITPKQKRTIRKTASRIPVSVRPARSLSVRKRIKDQFSSPALLSTTKKHIKEEFSSPWVSYNEV